MKCPFQWWLKLEAMVPIVGFFILQILLGIVGSQIKMKRIFFLAKIFINLKRYHLQSNNLDKLILVNKNWPNDLRVGYKSPSSLIEFIEMDANLEEELEEFEKVSENDEIVKI